MEIILALCVGVTLSAAAGFRVFVPPLVVSLAAIYQDFPLASGFEWLGTYPVAIALGIATIVEIVAYYIPVVDNLLDTIEIPLAIAVGIMMIAAILGNIEPVLQWTVAAIAGGISGIIEIFTSMTRLASTGMTGGTGNFLVSTMESLSAAILSILALTVPFLAASLAIGLLILAITKTAKLVPSLWQGKVK